MKRLSGRNILAALTITLAASALALITWAVATPQGARWLLSSVTALSGGSLSVRKVEGNIIGHLLLTGARVELGRRKLEIDGLELRWKPFLMLGGVIAIQELTLNGVRIQDDSPPGAAPPDLTWPRLPESARLFDAKIARMRVTNLSYRGQREQPVRIASISAAITWQDDILSIADLALVSPDGRMTGAISAGFKHPSLTTDLAIDPARPLGKMNRFSVLTRQSRDAGPERFVTAITLSGSAGKRKLLELSGDVGMERAAFNLRRLRLTRPGKKGELTADGSLGFTAKEPVLSLRIKAAGVDLTPELNLPITISGVLTFAGTPDRYRGGFTLANQARGWQSVTVSATYQGTRNGVKLAPLTARALDGVLAGNLDMDWRNGFAIQGAINGRNLNPARIAPDWQGVANFNVLGKLAWPEQAPPTGSVSASLLESRLHGQTLAGELRADFGGDTMSLKRLALQGKGFDLNASGNLNQRIGLSARISDFSRLIPGSAGTFGADGWVSRRDRRFSGAISGRGNGLAYAGTEIAAADLNVRLDQSAASPLQAAAALRDVVYGGHTLNTLILAADGTPPRHTLNATLRSNGAEATLGLTAGYRAGVWEGTINHLSGRDGGGPWNLTAPATFAASSGKLLLSPLVLGAGATERVEVSAGLTLSPLTGQVRAQWTGLNLARANSYLKDARITGSSQGAIRLGFLPGNRLSLSGSVSGSGTYDEQGHGIAVQRSLVTVNGGERGVRVDMELATAADGSMQASFSSPAPLGLAMPENGKLTAELNGIDLGLFKPWLPTGTVLAGRLSGRVNGTTLPGQRFELGGNGALSGGNVQRKSPDGELNLSFKAAEITWDWRGETLSGGLSLAMASHGGTRATFQLPLPARFPVAINQKGPLRIALSGQFQEKGIITALFPELVQESTGELNTDLSVNGTWEAPLVSGNARFDKAGAYLPTAGIQLRDVQLAARLEKDLIRIDSFRALSGPGHIQGSALITLDGWRVTGYKGAVGGENFQTVHFPELHMLCTPRLSFDGTPEKLTLRGELKLPEVNIASASSRSVITPSSDVILEGRSAPAARHSTLVLDSRIRVLIGDKVFVKIAGIDAQLGGAIDLTMNGLDRITSTGEIKVVKGRYRTYGVNLDIDRGRLFFSGGPIDRPTLDVLALRAIGDVKAGVTVTGTLKKPVTKLYSEPAMPDVDILAYVVLGHPFDSDNAQAGLMTQAAGALLSSGQAALLLDRIKTHLGLSTLEIQSGVGGTTNSMGYKPLQVTPPGSIPATQRTGVTETMLTVGKYLTPQLYLSYGRSLFTGSNLFRLRYDISRNWQIETQTGAESGVDLFYKLEFK